MQVTVRQGRAGRGGAVVKLFMGGMFIFVSTQIMAASQGTVWLHEVGIMWQAGSLDSEELFMAAFLAIFMLAGLGMLIGGIIGLVRGGTSGSEPPVDDTEPWLQRSDWAVGQAVWEPENHGSVGAVTMLLFFFVLTTAVAVYVTQDILGRGSDYGALALVWLFPVATALLSARSLRSIRQKRRFGKSVFKLDHVPGHLGARLAGTVVTTLPVDREPADGFHVRLSCYHRIVRMTTSSDGSQRERREHLLWRDEQHLRGIPGPEGVLTVPLRFDLPANIAPTRLAPLDDRIAWCLEVTGRQRGLDYTARFEVPVFEGAGDGVPAGEPELTFGGAAPAGATVTAAPDNRILEPFTGPTTPGVEVDLSPAGELERLHVASRAGRMIGIVLMVTGLVILGVGAGVMLSDEGPFLAVLIPGILAAVVLYAAVWKLTHSATLRMEGGMAQFQQGMFGGGRVQEVAIAALTGARVELSGTQVGRRAYYALLIDLQDGTTWNVTGLLRERREADHLARLVEDRITAIPAPA
jgi:hypothetical protein